MNPAPAHPLPGETAVGPVSLVARDRDGMARWYQAALGLETLADDGRAVVLGTASGTPLVTLVGDPDARPAPRREPGLFHVAILMPSRADLGRWMVHARRTGLALTGAADHLVSEAVYLDDPEGNGIEVYRDRERSEWPRRDSGDIKLANDPLDAEGIVASAAAEGRDYAGAPAGTIVGHVHLKVADLAATRAFFADTVGFDVVVDSYPGALFIAAGGYHHHFGLNVWNSAGSSRSGHGTGLDAATITLPRGAAGVLGGQLEAAGIPVGSRGGFPSVLDPSGNRLVLVDADLDAETALAVTRA